MDTLLPMLTSYRKHHIGSPGYITFDEWNQVLDRMIYLLKEMKKDDFSTEDVAKSYEYRNNCKDEFFKLFSEYFYNLWD